MSLNSKKKRPSEVIRPPLVNSAGLWVTTQDDLRGLYHCPSTGAVTTRTTIKDSFGHDDRIHQYQFYDIKTGRGSSDGQRLAAPTSLNSLGYSPKDVYWTFEAITELKDEYKEGGSEKPIIYSVSGNPGDVAEDCFGLLTNHISAHRPWIFEFNLSCPNIPGKPPPAYSKQDMTAFMDTIFSRLRTFEEHLYLVGIKVPPYTYHGQFVMLTDTLLYITKKWGRRSISFITASNTLGSCLVLDDSLKPIINSANGMGIGGLGGAALHPLALGNVKTIRAMLDQHPELSDVEIIGVGGVCDHAGYDRMRAAGAAVVGVGTALGERGLGVFDEILARSEGDRTDL